MQAIQAQKSNKRARIVNSAQAPAPTPEMLRPRRRKKAKKAPPPRKATPQVLKRFWVRFTQATVVGNTDQPNQEQIAKTFHVVSSSGVNTADVALTCLYVLSNYTNVLFDTQWAKWVARFGRVATEAFEVNKLIELLVPEGNQPSTLVFHATAFAVQLALEDRNSEGRRGTERGWLACQKTLRAELGKPCSWEDKDSYVALFRVVGEWMLWYQGYADAFCILQDLIHFHTHISNKRFASETVMLCNKLAELCSSVELAETERASPELVHYVGETILMLHLLSRVLHLPATADEHKASVSDRIKQFQHDTEDCVQSVCATEAGRGVPTAPSVPSPGHMLVEAVRHEQLLDVKARVLAVPLVEHKEEEKAVLHEVDSKPWTLPHAPVHLGRKRIRPNPLSDGHSGGIRQRSSDWMAASVEPMDSVD